MTIKDAISLMNITDITFIPQMYGINKAGVLPVYPTNQGVCYYEGESIWSIGISDQCQDEIYKIKHWLCGFDKNLYDNARELDKYVAVFVILNAVDRCKKGNGSIRFEDIKDYVDILNNAIYEALDLKQISDMDTLKEIITSDTLYREMLFNVDEVNTTKDREFTWNGKDKKEYSFGNIKYHEEHDRVFIRTYDDCVALACEKEGRSYKQNLDIRRSYTSEEKILAALNCWRDYYYN